VKHGKPHADLLVLALQRINAETSGAAMVGATPYDMIPASKLGLTAVGLLTGGFPEVRLRAAGASCVCSNVTSLSRSENSALNLRNNLR
jgi:phosphoglycolate phosphatase-like HAD superfamily hydrolase